jgi:hypothetical protein
MDDEALWKQRFLLFMIVRLAGLVIFFLGIAIAFSDLLREGGMPTLGGFLAIIGVIDAVFAPRVLKKMWQRN